MVENENKNEKSVLLGKRKSRDGGEEEQFSGSTLFVSNLPYTATSIDLQTLFSDLAPVRSTFVVLEGGVSKGVGYVSFAIKEDASKAMETIEMDGIAINGRKLRVQLADRKPKEKSDAKEPKSDRKTLNAPRPSFPKTPKDPNAIRTIAISGLPSSVDQKTLWKKVRKCEGAESAELVEGGSGEAHALFKSPATASHAVERLHAHIFKGSILSVTLKKRLETLAKAPAKQVSGQGSAARPAPSRGSRLIVRNLPWGITEQDLRALFLPFGPVYSTTIPAEVSTDGGKPRARGFAFVWFFSKKDAERAIDGVNGRLVTPGAVTAPTMNKKERARLRKKLREQKKEGDGDEGVEEAEESDVEDSVRPVEELKAEARVLAVDWALSKEKWEEAKAKDLAEQQKGEASDEESRSEDESGSAVTSDGSTSGSGDDNDEGEEESEGDSEMDVDVDDGRSDGEDAVRPTLPQVDVGTTLFVRNVPFDATEDELRTLFRAFGPLRYARITMEAATGRSRGTGFVCFWNKEDADKAVHQSELLSRETGPEAPKKNPFSLPSLLTPDPSSSLAQSLVLHGRTLDVARAVTRDEAQKLKDEGERSREKADKRNMYLIREGVIFPNTPAAASLSSAELEKRSVSFATRRALLKSNPLLYVSKTRLSIRQLPAFTTERSLKRLGIHAVRAFEAEVKRGERQALSADELREDVAIDLEVGEDGAVGEKGKERDKGKDKGKGKGKKFERETKVKQAKIVRQSDRVDALTGKGRSKGYGFLEMKVHSDALRVLRWANNNPAVAALLEQWWTAEVEELVKGLGEAVKKQKGKKEDVEDGEDVEARLKRLKDELERLKAGEARKGRKALVIEFSIENAQVVTRRKEKNEIAKEEKPSRSRPSRHQENDGDKNEDGNSSKRRKMDEDAPALTRSRSTSKVKPTEGDDAPVRQGKGLGSLIGRKRKMRKATRGKA